ncbi:ATP-binding protein [Poseidonibacter ostreae]|jgi:SpoVK/Ycf46/Vps4 family AAA+-type ATPase|uniref:AAA family ATPase n=1 Tax=Poseidonibacter ostreae TaxID=2654171 RepID=A0A6L4WRJ2_9BACT|nr:ATP-binding protein [Poseidonibacter ostreae]KAB7886720.1 AAA family ATPase [Poseidonibacter ostreae]KAB7888190.1 AAA family ATPase [Poseidonibacter ostreae]KAB7892034.1 AAA family ATPase [Poseidonibacter ostreae]MAC83510.1 AAA family ATPase [Arcobacter sp.]|tara:strand:- start:1596 stop:3329 length:1734 start_codon:yes stop_codon:yes gene_type:complete
MKELIDFIKSKKIEDTNFYAQLKCTKEEAILLQFITKEYTQGRDSLVVIDVLSKFYDTEKFEHLEKLNLIKSLLEFGWLVQISFDQIKLNEISKLELLNSSISLSSSYLKLLENGSNDFVLPEIKNYSDHLEYLQDQFFKIDLAQQLNVVKKNFAINSPSSNRLKSKLVLLENRIKERIKVTSNSIMLEDFFKENDLKEQEQTLFLALLKEEYSGGDGSIRDMNALIELISSDDYEKIKYRSLLEESSTLVANSLVDYDEVLTAFGGINRNFYIPDEVLYKISHPTKKKTRGTKIKLDSIIKEQDTFELINTSKTLEDVVLNDKTRETLSALLKQVDKDVINRLRQWGIKDKKKGIEAKIIFYGVAGTGKTLTALAMAKSLKKDVLSFDCSKILSMYVGESEKNVRSIFDKYYELREQTKSEPVLLLNEADQFLSGRTSGAGSGSDKMHNQMQNIFLEQIEKFDGILIATTNLLENLDKAFSRRFNYKIEFIKPNKAQRLELWKKLLPSNLPLSQNFDIDKLATYDLTGGQIELIIKNTAYKIAATAEPIFNVKDFEEQITKEQKGQFDSENKVGFF